MLMAGKNVTQLGDALHPLTLERLYLGLTQPKASLIDLLQQLRALKTIDTNGYRKAKTKLPYIVCGNFSPAFRKKDHFAWIEHFILDLDHLSSKDLNPQQLKSSLKQDERIALMFTSPGNDGVKILFNLKNRIHDAAYYSSFYKTFAASFALQYKLEGAVDLVTSDVSRCCFMSHDTEAFYNPQASSVDAAEWLDPNSLQGLSQALALVKDVTQASKEALEAAGVQEAQKQELPQDLFFKIRQKLNPALAQRPTKTKEFFQPQALTESLPALKDTLLEMGITLEQADMIQYGRKLKLTAGSFWAEVNLFHGREGFKVVQTTKTGSNKELAQLCVSSIQLHFDRLADFGQHQTDMENI